MINDITRSDLIKIINLLNNHKITSKQITLIYCYRAGTIGKDLCLIT
jgi:hypothetical protein